MGAVSLAFESEVLPETDDVIDEIDNT